LILEGGRVSAKLHKHGAGVVNRGLPQSCCKEREKKLAEKMVRASQKRVAAAARQGDPIARISSHF
jgi:hypothetical protein